MRDSIRARCWRRGQPRSDPMKPRACSPNDSLPAAANCWRPSSSPSSARIGPRRANLSPVQPTRRSLSTAEARIDWVAPAADIVRKVRAFNPRPGAHTTWRGERFKIHRAAQTFGNLAPGHLKLLDGRLLAGSADGAVHIERVQPAGAREMSSSSWVRGIQGEPGRFE